MKAKAEEREIRRRIVGKFLRASREDRGVTQEELALRLGYSTAQYVSNWERGVSLPPMDQLPKIASFLEVTPSALLETMYSYQEAMLRLHKRQLAALFRVRAR